MATAKPAYTSAVSEIQQRMAQIRHDMHQEVRGAVKGAHSLTDWRSMIGNYPWLSLGAAAAVGYLIVPWRVSPPQTVVHVAPAPDAGSINPLVQPAKARRTGWKVLGAMSSLLIPVAVRAAQNYALTYFEQWLEHHPLHPRGVEPESSNATEQKPDGPEFQGARFRSSL
jgi:hypothetical protein